MRFKAFGTAAVVALALAAPAVKAETITMTSQVDGDVFGGIGSQTVSMTGVPGRGNVSALAGAFRVTDSARNFLTWCVDAAKTLNLPSSYSTTTTPFAGNDQGSLGVDVRSNIQRLFDTAYRDLDLNSSVQTAGFQMALWEIIYDGTQNFSANSNDDVEGAASTFLAALRGQSEMS